MTGKRIKNPRELAVICANEVEQKRILVPEAMAVLAIQMSEADLNLAHEITYGTFRYLPGLTRWLAGLCKPRKLPPKIRWLLLTSLYQLRYLRTPSYAVLNEANELAKRMRFGGLKALVNGVLRNSERNESRLCDAFTQEDWLLPPWLSTLLKSQYEEAEISRWLACWSTRGNLSYWCKDGQALPGDIASESLPHSWKSQAPIHYETYAERGLYVQNESAQAIAEMVCRLGANSVLDLCAAPGGKACYMAHYGSATRLLACDLPERIGRLRENRDRLGLNFEIQGIDAQALEAEPFDLVLLDAPCSGIGIIGRHPEIKFLKTEPADEDLRANQACLLEVAWKHVKLGGRLFYTVCSLDTNEIPALPAHSQAINQLDASFLARLPLKVLGDQFYFSPNASFDGFRGTLLQKDP